MTSLLFLLSRGLSCSVIVAAPAVVLSVILGWNVTLTALAICVPAIVYTMLGGVQAVTWTDVKVMGLTVFVLLAAVVVLVMGLPANVGVGGALHVAGATGRLDAFDFRFTLGETYTFWSGLLGGLFLMLSYFGCDQSQVQRYLTAPLGGPGALVAADERLLEDPAAGAGPRRRRVHVPLLRVQPAADALPPGAGRPCARAVPKRPATWRSRANSRPPSTARRQAAEDVRRGAGHRRRRGAAAGGRSVPAARGGPSAAVRARAIELVKRTSGESRYTDVNYVFPTFITTVMPIGLVGLWIVAIITAATDSIAAELNSLATATVIDFYKRHYRPAADDGALPVRLEGGHGAWGLFACCDGRVCEHPRAR